MRAARSQLETRELGRISISAQAKTAYFSLGPCQALSSARKTTPDPVQLSQFRGPSELVSPLRFSRRIKYASDSAVIVADVIYRPAARTIFYGARGEEEGGGHADASSTRGTMKITRVELAALRNIRRASSSRRQNPRYFSFCRELPSTFQRSSRNNERNDIYTHSSRDLERSKVYYTFFLSLFFLIRFFSVIRYDFIRFYWVFRFYFFIYFIVEELTLSVCMRIFKNVKLMWGCSYC